MNYSIIHADRDFRYHEKLKELLAPYGELVFKEHCCYLDSALQLLKPLQTDILITGSKLYDEANAVEALCQYRDVHMPQLKIIVLTSKEDTDHLLNSIVAGVNGVKNGRRQQPAISSFFWKKDFTYVTWIEQTIWLMN